MLDSSRRSVLDWPLTYQVDLFLEKIAEQGRVKVGADVGRFLCSWPSLIPALCVIMAETGAENIQLELNTQSERLRVIFSGPPVSCRLAELQERAEREAIKLGGKEYSSRLELETKDQEPIPFTPFISAQSALFFLANHGYSQSWLSL